MSLVEILWDRQLLNNLCQEINRLILRNAIWRKLLLLLFNDAVHEVLCVVLGIGLVLIVIIVCHLVLSRCLIFKLNTIRVQQIMVVYVLVVQLLICIKPFSIEIVLLKENLTLLVDFSAVFVYSE